MNIVGCASTPLKTRAVFSGLPIVPKEPENIVPDGVNDEKASEFLFDEPGELEISLIIAEDSDCS